LQAKYSLKIENENIVINAQIIPNPELVGEILKLKDACLVKDENIILLRHMQFCIARFCISYFQLGIIRRTYG